MHSLGSSAALFLLGLLVACQATPAAESASPMQPAASDSLATEAVTAPPGSAQAAAAPPFGRIDRYDAALDAIVPKDWKLEKLAEGFGWAEGPAWIAAGSYLLFTDVPGNTIHKWT